MNAQFKVGDRVRWHSEDGQANGKITHVHQSDIDYQGITHLASADDPQYEIRNDSTRHFVIHKRSALQKID
jgi:Hypervirulence associated proteins TUDOR domain